MKKVLINGILFLFITIGTAYALYQIQTKADAQTLDSHAGHAHAQESALEQHEDEHTSRDPNRLWCNEHSVYEDECEICHPEIAGSKETEQEHDHEESDGHIETEEGLVCTTHNLPELLCGICQPQLAAQLMPGESMMVRLASSQSLDKAGIQTGKPLPGSIQEDQGFFSKVLFNQNHFGHISPLASGVVQKVFVDQGDKVEQGQVLLEIASNQIANAKSNYLKSLDRERLCKLTFDRENELSRKNITALQEYQQAEAEYQVAQAETKATYQQLINYGLSVNDIDAVRSQRSNTSTLTVRAPFRGTLVEKHAVLGEAVDAGESIFQIVDLSTMWLELSIPESRIATVKPGDPILGEFASLPEKTFEGRLTWISARIDENTRMLKARAEIPNPSETLKQGLFGRVRILNASPTTHLLVPQETVQQIDGRFFVFVQTDDDLFELRYVIPGDKANGQIEIIQGLSPQDNIVIANSFALKSEFLKSRFGAGCAHD